MLSHMFQIINVHISTLAMNLNLLCAHVAITMAAGLHHQQTVCNYAARVLHAYPYNYCIIL